MIENATQGSGRPTRPVVGGGYRFIPSVFQFSGGVAAEPQFSIERVTLVHPVPLAEGLTQVEAHMVWIGRPTRSICAIELRSPGQFSDADFVAFNRTYVTTLDRWGLMDGDVNPVARTNVCPAQGRPPTPSLHSFAYTVPDKEGGVDFVTAGGAEAPEGKGDYRDGIVRRGDVSLDGLRDKLRYVRDEQQVRLNSLGRTWTAATQINAYCPYDIGPLLADELLARHAGSCGVTVHVASPPVQDCEFEMDAHRISRMVLR